jgi:hypothetical protein
MRTHAESPPEARARGVESRSGAEAVRYLWSAFTYGSHAKEIEVLVGHRRLPRAWMRALPTFSAGAGLFFLTALLLSNLSPPIALAIALLSLGVILLGCSVLLFSQPRILIPAQWREEVQAPGPPRALVREGPAETCVATGPERETRSPVLLLRSSLVARSTSWRSSQAVTD